jgi:hypothetical protein
MGWYAMESSGSGLGPVRGFCKHANDHSDSVQWQLTALLNMFARQICSGQEFLQRITQTNIANMTNTIFWDVTPCCLVDVYRCFDGSFCLHPQCRISQKKWGLYFCWTGRHHTPKYNVLHSQLCENLKLDMSGPTSFILYRDSLFY